MAAYPVKKIVEDIRIALDENRNSGALQVSGDIDTLTLDGLIRSKIEDAALSVVLAAPADKLSDIAKSLSEGSVVIANDTRLVGKLNVPNDFARLVSVKLKSWPHSVFEAHEPGTTDYVKANSEFSIYGTKERPAVFLVPCAGGKKHLELFRACGSNDELDSFLYVAIPKIDGEDEEEETQDSGQNNDQNGGQNNDQNSGQNNDQNSGQDSGQNNDDQNEEPNNDDQNDEQDKSSTINGNYFVDLGLPSRTLWASRNIGAENEEDCGEYFAWGETSKKLPDEEEEEWEESYNWSTYKYNKGGQQIKLTKYCTNGGNGYNGFVDDLTTLEAEDDAAAQRWGGCKMPNEAQFNELFNSNYTTCEWEDASKGLRITSKLNGNSILLPAGGHKNWNSLIRHKEDAIYWANELSGDDTTSAKAFQYSPETFSGVRVDDEARIDGCSVRPVYNPTGTPLSRRNASRANAVSGSTIELGERLLRPTIYYAAYLTALAIKDGDAATALQGIAKELLGVES